MDVKCQIHVILAVSIFLGVGQYNKYLLIISSFFIFIEFCPVDCDEKMCPGEWDPKTGEQMTPDFCIPNKVGDCPSFCPMKCGENDMMCPGKMDPNGCKMPDTCISGSTFFLDF